MRSEQSSSQCSPRSPRGTVSSVKDRCIPAHRMAEQAVTELRNGEEDKHKELLQAEVQALMMSVPSLPKINEANIPSLDSPCPSHSEEIATRQNSGLGDVHHNSSSPTQENIRKTDLEEMDSFNLIEPPPLDWRSDSSSEAGCVGEADSEGFLQTDSIDMSEDPPSEDGSQLATSIPEAPLLPYQVDYRNNGVGQAFKPSEKEVSQDDVLKGQEEEHQQEEEKHQQEEENKEQEGTVNEQCGQHDVDHSQIHTLLSHLQLISPSPAYDSPSPEPAQTLLDRSDLRADLPYDTRPNLGTVGEPQAEGTAASGLLFTESHQRDLLGLLETPSSPEERPQLSLPCLSYGHLSTGVDAVVSVSYSQEDAERYWEQTRAHDEAGDEIHALDDSGDDASGLLWQRRGEPPAEEEGEDFAARCPDMDAEARPAYKDVPGPCDPEDLLDGVIFGAKYLGSTQLQSDKNPSTSARMAQAQEAVERIKAPEGESQPMTEVDLFISTQRIKVLNADTQAMMDHSLQMISYIADIGNIVVLMARRKPVGRKDSDPQAANPSAPPKKCWMLCHVFTSDDAQVIAQAIGQAFAVAYQQFLQTNGMKPDEYDDFLSTQELYNGDLVHFSRSENIREVCIRKAIGEILGLAVVESGWGSILPTVVVANLLHGGPAERSGELSIGDRIMSVNGTSMVGLPIATCNNIIRDLKNQAQVKLSIVHCPPVTMAIIKRPDPKYQLGFSVEDGIICSLMRGGIAERGGIRVGHRIIEINGQSVVATPHEKIIHILTNAVGEIHLKTMPASTYRLLTGQEQPVFL
ncbi:amyloid-beta A4 precursor protein-binding family A member 3 isoform X2 [Clupea harengus]|uniref:Amyloid-beta A4 precursor protein-binding family A member 3 n=1 Tax=Clupea harengus TaxID=7950 RepID=A0A8M1K7T7_CLUHA|nr:amyloid-beta A4 precursor protein-binding family A member 3 isoform X2 [Clupea harengus]